MPVPPSGGLQAVPTELYPFDSKGGMV